MEDTKLFTVMILSSMLDKRLLIDDKEEQPIKDIMLNPFKNEISDEVAIRLENDKGIFIRFEDLFDLMRYGMCDSKEGVLRLL